MTLSLILTTLVLLLLSTLIYQGRQQHKLRSLRLQGLDQVQSLLESLRLLQQHRGLERNLLNGRPVRAQLLDVRQQLERIVRQIDPAMLESLPQIWPQWCADWHSLCQQDGQLSLQDSFHCHTGLINRLLDMVWRIADLHGLTSHPQPWVRQQALATLQVLPELAECLGQLRALGSQAANDSKRPALLRLTLCLLLARSRRLSEQAALEHSLQRDIDQLLLVIEQLGQNASTRLEGEHLFQQATQVIDALLQSTRQRLHDLQLQVQQPQGQSPQLLEQH
ncbi:hypothetical protein [Balneatrix alpica]|uniref:Nitrate/nitrite sensing protein domain-containing protein n=1 Tax=Balneatrix alpica TaxID=75684 RepID=A0ABV5Z7K7_9GAMM|nr:hypothetical protein [Balneatrix alpica]